MDNDIKIIQDQTDILDIEKIKTTFLECNKDITETIIKLSNLKSKTIKKIKEKTIFDEMRYILDAKDNIYQQQVQKNT